MDSKSAVTEPEADAAVKDHAEANGDEELVRADHGTLNKSLHDHYTAKFKADQTNGKNVRSRVSNIMRAHRVFMEANGLNDASPLGREVLDGQESEEALKRLHNVDFAKATTGGVKSRVKNQVFPLAVEMIKKVATDEENETFAERLTRLMKEKGWTSKSMAREFGVGRNPRLAESISKWAESKCVPLQSNRSKVQRLEALLQEPPGTLTGKLPKQPFRAPSHRAALKGGWGMTENQRRKLTKHLPHDFDARSFREQSEIVSFVINNILCAPVEDLEKGGSTKWLEIERSVFSLARHTDHPELEAPTHLLNEIDRIVEFKTVELVPEGKCRKRVWNPATTEKEVDNFLAFFGALRSMGFPDAALSFWVILVPSVVDAFINWRRRRRGGYTTSITMVLTSLEGLLNSEFGYIKQTENFGESPIVHGTIVRAGDVERIRGDWTEACRHARKFVQDRRKEVNELLKPGRDPFRPIRAVIGCEENVIEEPIRGYAKIIGEIRSRMPDPRYPGRHAVAQRALMMLRLALKLAFRPRTMRELLICLPGTKPREWGELAVLRRGELSFDPGQGWIVRLPNFGLKNPRSSAVKPRMVLPLRDSDGLYDELAAYLKARVVLLNGEPDPGTLFVKDMTYGKKKADLSEGAFEEAWQVMIETYAIHNPYTGRGAIEGLLPHASSAVRHVLATTLVRKTGGFSAAAHLLLDTEEVVKKHYGEFLPGNGHVRSQEMIDAILQGNGGPR